VVRKSKAIDISLGAVVMSLVKGSGMTNKITEEIQPKRTVYYSSILALSSAALAYLGQYALSTQGDAYNTLIAFSVLFFGLTLVTLIVIYFLQVIHGVHWGKVMGAYEKITNEGPLEDAMKALDHDYFKKNPEEKQPFRVSMYISARLLGIETILDFLLLTFVSLAVVTYTVMLILSFLG